MDISQPSLAMSAALHLGTLVAVLIYFREDLALMLRAYREPDGRRLIMLIAIGTIPALIGFFVRDTVENIQENVQLVGLMLLVTGVVLVVGQIAARGYRNLLDGRLPDAVVVGIAQAFALIPGISRSGMTIAAGNMRRFDPSEAARFAFLLGIPAIAGAGLLSLPDLANEGADIGELLVGLAVAGVSGYFAIALLLAALRRIGLIPFALYCFVVGGLTIYWL